MPKVIIITNVDLEGYYNYTMEYLDAKYHRFPNSFPDVQISEEYAGQINSLNNMASHLGETPRDPHIPTGKLVL